MADFDIDEFTNRYLAEQQELQAQQQVQEPEATQEIVDEDAPVEVEVEQMEEPQSEIPESSEVVEPLEESPVAEKPKQTPEENRAFAEMRLRMKEMEEKAKEAEKYQQFLNELASSSGVTPEVLMAQVQKAQIEKQAKQQGVSPEMFQRMQTLEQENARIRNEMAMARLQGEVEATKAKYGLSDDDVTQTFQYMGQGGYLDPKSSLPTIRFEDAYFLAHRDSLIERKAKQAQQQLLANKKQRQSQAIVPHDGQAVAPNNTPQWDRDSIEQKLNSMGLSLK